MSWARHAESRRLLHVSMLKREQTGLACGCVCPACEGVLQAVNAGRDAEYFARPGARGQFFRHDVGQHRDDCLIKAARLAALQLLTEQDVICLPPHVVTHEIQGVSGQFYAGSARSDAVQARVINRQWLDEHAAVIHLDDGRRILIRLETRTVARLGEGVHAVITIRVNDPEVASWSPTTILEKASLVGGLACWDSHWLDEELRAAAQQDALQQAQRADDLMSAELAAYASLQGMQRNESVLHWKIKEFLRESTHLWVREWRDTVFLDVPGLEGISKDVWLPPCRLQLQNIRLEQRVHGVVPDVICLATDPRGHLGTFDLLIEVAVTHRVDDKKREVLARLNLACVELDIRHLKIKGATIGVKELHRRLAGAQHAVSWVHHPHMALERAEATKALEQRRGVLLERLHDAKKRQHLLRRLDHYQTAALYLQALSTLRTDGRSLNFEGLEWRTEDLEQDLSDKTSVPRCFLGEGGLFDTLQLIRLSAKGELPAWVSVYQVIMRALMQHEMRTYASLVLMAYATYRPRLALDEEASVKEQVGIVRGYVIEGRQDYARPTGHDPLIRHLFPELAAGLAKKGGTRDYADRVRRTRADVLAKKNEEAARFTQIEQMRQIQIAEEKYREDLISTLAKGGWQEKLGFTRDLDQVLALDEVKTALRSYKPTGLDVKFVLAQAWSARESGVALATWLRSCEADIEKLHVIGRLLRKAWLID